MKEIHILYALDKIEVFRSMMVQTRWFKKGGQRSTEWGDLVVWRVHDPF